MQLSIATGATRNYIRLIAETPRDFNQIAGIFSSKFVKEHFDWFFGPFPIGRDQMGFDIYVSKPGKDGVTQELLSQIDSTP